MDSARQIRPFISRHPRLAVFAIAAAGVGIGIKYQADSMKRNEMAQKTATAGPNYYVTVDRSGGGV